MCSTEAEFITVLVLVDLVFFILMLPKLCSISESDISCSSIRPRSLSGI